MHVTRQPQTPRGIDWSCPLTRGLRVAWLPAGAIDPVAIKNYSGVGIQDIVGSHHGFAPKTNGTSSYLFRDFWPLTSQVDATIFALVQSSGTVSTDRRAFAVADAASTATILSITTGTADTSKLSVWARTAASQTPTALISTGTVFDGTPHSAALTVKGTLLSSYVDGAADVTTTFSGNSGFNLNRAAVGCLYRSTTSNFFAGGVYVGLVWDRALTSAEITSLNSNPWQIFEAPRRVYKALAAVGGVALDDSGSFPGFEAQSNPTVISVW